MPDAQPQPHYRAGHCSTEGWVATRSIAADALTFTPLGESWYAVSPDTLNLAQAVIQRYTFPFIWDPVIIQILTLPGWLVFFALSLIFYIVGYRRRRTVLA